MIKTKAIALLALLLISGWSLLACWQLSDFHLLKHAVIRVDAVDGPVVAGDCVIPFYGAYAYEFKWLTEVLLSDLPRHGCHVVVRESADMLKDFEAQTKGGVFTPAYPHVIFLMVTFADNRKLWTEPLYRNYFFEQSTVVQLSDEVEDYPWDYLQHLPRVFRNYHGHGDRAGTISHLANNSVDAQSLVQLSQLPHDAGQSSWWFPLGYSSAMLGSQTLSLPLLKRPKLFFWSGGLGGKPERDELLASLRNASSEIMAAGTVHTYGGFLLGLGSGDHLKPLDYTRFLYSAAVVPCPAGGSPEQFRISEAFEADAIPMVKRGHAHLRYMDTLKLRYIGIADFKESAAELDSVRSNATYRGILADWQIQNRKRWTTIKKRVGRHFAATIIAAIMRNGNNS